MNKSFMLLVLDINKSKTSEICQEKQAYYYHILGLVTQRQLIQHVK